jgi:antitoxin HicB
MKPKYTMIIQWSDEDQKYIVSLPEWGDLAHTPGATYEEAAKNGSEVLEMLLEDEREGKPVSAPRLFETGAPV